MPTVKRSAASERRVQFDFEIDFFNGGGIQGQRFRLDIEGDDIRDDELAAFIVRDLRLLMVGEVRILNKQIIREPHKRTRVTAEASDGYSRVRIDLGDTVEAGCTTPPAPSSRSARSRCVRTPVPTSAAPSTATRTE
jgi:arylformamidase